MNPIANIKTVLPKYRGRKPQLSKEFGEYKYCGWGNKRLGLRTSPLANPYTTKRNARKERIFVSNRDEAVSKYRQWLWGRIKANNLALIHELCQITPETTLVCWCAPARCHCEVIAQAANWVRQQDKLSFQMMRAGFSISHDSAEFSAYWGFHNGGDGEEKGFDTLPLVAAQSDKSIINNRNCQNPSSFVTFTLDKEGQWWVAMRTDDYGNPHPERRHPVSVHFISKWIDLILTSPKEVLCDYREHIFEHMKKAGTNLDLKLFN